MVNKNGKSIQNGNDDPYKENQFMLDNMTEQYQYRPQYLILLCLIVC